MLNAENAAMRSCVLYGPDYLSLSMRILLAALLIGLFGLGACAPSSTVVPPPSVDSVAIRTEVRAVLDAQVEQWNAGSVRGFMAGYANTDSLMFLSGGTVRRGYEEALYAYIRNYPSTAAMGTLSFSDLHIQPLSPDYAHVWGHWSLRRESDAPGGLFTLLFSRTARGWKVVHDHTSSEE